MPKLKIEVVRALLALAHADDHVSPDEQRLLDFLLDSYGLTDEDKVAIQKTAHHPTLNEQELANHLQTEPEREQAYELAVLLSLMDGEQQFEESQMLTKIREALHIAVDRVIQIEGRSKKVYEAYKNKHNGQG
ncbi:MAG: TerB family tellurite resistance protein [Deltaproteobacteria bacterium]|nr:TerB family tellurite resistance protein [Deltaproteobacteria bacterium]